MVRKLVALPRRHNRSADVSIGVPLAPRLGLRGWMKRVETRAVVARGSGQSREEWYLLRVRLPVERIQVQVVTVELRMWELL